MPLYQIETENIDTKEIKKWVINFKSKLKVGTRFKNKSGEGLKILKIKRARVKASK